MYTTTSSSITKLIKSFWKKILWYVLYVSAIYIAYEYLGFEQLDIKMSIATVLGFAVALLLGFRTSASYDRWWEARKIWGGIVNDSRTLVRKLIGFTDPENILPEIKQMANYQIAWCHALKNSLRDLDPFEELDPYLKKEEIEVLKGKLNVPNEILKLMSTLLLKMRKDEKVDAYQMVSVDQTIKDLCDHMGKCERINNTVFPVQYRSYTHKGIMIFIGMLPYGMLYSTGPFVIVICLLVAFFFYMLENIAAYLQDPFQNKGSDIPMSALTQTIEINLLELIGHSDVPKPLKPNEKGILM